MKELKKLYVLLKQFLIFGIIVFTCSFIVFCNGKQTQKDFKNALSITQSLKSKTSSTPKKFTPIPEHNEKTSVSYAVKQHVLKPGETLHDLAVLYNTDLQSIQRANGIKELNEMKPGQKILIPIKQSHEQ